MGRPERKVQSGFVLFDVCYEDGARTSNRKVPASKLSGPDGDAPARAFVEMQDRMIGEMSGMSRGRIKTILRSQNQVNGLGWIVLRAESCSTQSNKERTMCAVHG